MVGWTVSRGEAAAMPKGPAPPWRARDCRFDHVVAAAIENGQLVYDGIGSPERALEIKRGVYRCAQHRKVSVKVSWPFSGTMTSKSDSWPPDKVKGAYQLTIEVFRKSHGRTHVVTEHGTDRQLWPYNPRKKEKGR